VKPGVLGIDIGTSGAHGVLVDESGAMTATADVSYPMHRPELGWAVQDPMDWWRAFVEVCRQLAAQVGECGIRIGAIGLSGQQAGLVRVDASGEPIGDGILWCDNRSDPQARRLQAAAHTRGDALRFGGPITGAQWASKMDWLNAAQAADDRTSTRIMGVKDFVRSRMCPQLHATDPVEASVSGLFDVAAGDWLPERLDELGLPASAMPEVVAPEASAGTLSPELQDVLGIDGPVPVTVGIGDCGAGALGAGAVRPGSEYLGFGSSGITLRVQRDFAPDSQLRVRTCRYLADGTWFTMGVVQTLGLSWNWLRDTFAQLGQDTAHGATERLCRKSEPGARGLVFVPYLMGDQTPHMDGRLRAAFVGLDISHTAADLSRAVLEGMAFAMWDAFQALPGQPAPGRLSVVGKPVDNRLWLEIVAAIFGRPLQPVPVHEGSAYGAAMLAQALCGGERVDAVADRWMGAADGTVEPEPELSERMAQAYERYQRAVPASGLLATDEDN
jgi:xylulokinase